MDGGDKLTANQRIVVFGDSLAKAATQSFRVARKPSVALTRYFFCSAHRNLQGGNRCRSPTSLT